MSLPSGVAALRHSARLGRLVSYRTTAGAGCYHPRSGSRTSSIRASRETIGRGRPGSPRDATDESTFPWPHIAAKDFRSFSTAIGRPVTILRRHARVATFGRTAPTHHTAATRHHRTAELASQNVRRLRAYVLRPRDRPGLRSPVFDPRHSVPFVRSY